MEHAPTFLRVVLRVIAITFGMLLMYQAVYKQSVLVGESTWWAGPVEHEQPDWPVAMAAQSIVNACKGVIDLCGPCCVGRAAHTGRRVDRFRELLVNISNGTVNTSVQVRACPFMSFHPFGSHI